jgi:hypothetical protein
VPFEMVTQIFYQNLLTAFPARNKPGTIIENQQWAKNQYGRLMWENESYLCPIT